jgi:hypothetical protein
MVPSCSRGSRTTRRGASPRERPSRTARTSGRTSRTLRSSVLTVDRRLRMRQWTGRTHASRLLTYARSIPTSTSLLRVRARSVLTSTSLLLTHARTFPIHVSLLLLLGKTALRCRFELLLRGRAKRTSVTTFLMALGRMGRLATSPTLCVRTPRTDVRCFPSCVRGRGARVRTSIAAIARFVLTCVASCGSSHGPRHEMHPPERQEQRAALEDRKRHRGGAPGNLATEVDAQIDHRHREHRAAGEHCQPERRA